LVLIACDISLYTQVFPTVIRSVVALSMQFIPLFSTFQVIREAARNSQSGRDVMLLLLDRRGDKVTITEEVVKVTARNFGWVES
jgi:hypothetical protein